MYDYIIYPFPYCFIPTNPIKSTSVRVWGHLFANVTPNTLRLDFNQDEEYNKDEI